MKWDVWAVPVLVRRKAGQPRCQRSHHIAKNNSANGRKHSCTTSEIVAASLNAWDVVRSWERKPARMTRMGMTMPVER